MVAWFRGGGAVRALPQGRRHLGPQLLSRGGVRITRDTETSRCDLPRVISRAGNRNQFS